MGQIVISGCATGIGAAIRKRLEADGHRVIGVDIKGSEILADLSDPEARKGAVAEALEQAGGELDHVVLCAGLGGHIHDDVKVACVNYFGAVDLLDGFFDALRKGSAPSALVICSNSAQLAPALADSPLVAAMLEHDEAEARRLAPEAGGGQVVYMMSKNALGRAVRRRALEWGEAGVRLNSLAPGPVMTPLLRGGLDTPGEGDLIRGFKVPLGRFGEPEEMAGIARFLLGPEASFVHGSVWYADGGADANVRPDLF